MLGLKWEMSGKPFTTNQGLFEPLVILHPFIDHNIAICYMDDILIFTSTLEEHHLVTHEILNTLRHH